MREYELTIGFSVKEQGFNAGLEATKNLLSKYGFTIKKEEDMGELSLAYEVRKEKRAHYYYFSLGADGQQNRALKESLRLVAPVLVFLLVNIG